MIYGERRRKRSLAPLAFGISLLTVAGVVFVGLGMAGKLPWQHHMPEPPEPGMVRVWLAARPIPPFTTVTAEYLFNPAIGMAAFRDYPENLVPKQMLAGTQGEREILNRVLAKAKQAGQPFFDSDFLPKGTLPGVVAGVPENMRALTLEADKLKGIDTLQVGDHLDLLAAVPVDRLLSTGDREQAWRPGTPLLAETRHTNSGAKQTETRMIACNAIIISPLATHMRPITTSSMMQGTSVRTVPVQEVVLAIDRQDVAGTTEAIDMGLEMACIARSGRPNSNDRIDLPAGMSAVPVAVRFIPAYSELVHDDLYDVRTRDLRYVLLPSDEVKSQQIVDSPAELVGRVVARDRTLGQFFRRDDLLPLGTSPGLAAGIPPGKRAFAIAADKLVGSGALRHGDHIDVLVSVPFSLDKQSHGAGADWLPTSGTDAASLQLEKQAEVRVVAHDAVVVAPVATPKFAPSAAGMTATKEVADTLEHSSQELELAVSADEVAKLWEAVSLGMQLTAVSRSGVATDPSAASHPRQSRTDDTPVSEFRPLSGVGKIEMIDGAKRETTYYFRGAVAEHNPDAAGARTIYAK